MIDHPGHHQTAARLQRPYFTPEGLWILGEGLSRELQYPRFFADESVAEFDQDCRSALDYLAKHGKVATGRLGAAGFCIGGHLAFRAALQSDVRATVCFYGTGIHDGKLGKDADAHSLARAPEIKGELLMIFGELDPHVPKEGRDKIEVALRNAGTKFRMKLYPAEHAFMRDEGPRYDPESTDSAFSEMVQLFRRTLAKA